MTTLTICNQKGGVSKTTSSTALASRLNKNGYKTLLIDTDPQGNASSIYQVQEAEHLTLLDVMDDSCLLEETIQSTPYGDIIPSHHLLSEADIRYTQQGREYILKEAMAGLENTYDFVIIDTPPSKGVVMVNTLTASNYLIIPVVVDSFSIEGLSKLKGLIEASQKYSNPNLKVMGILLTQDQKNTKASKGIREALDSISHSLNTVPFKTSIPSSIKVKEATIMHTPLPYYAPYSEPAMAYNKIIEEILERIEQDNQTQTEDTNA